MKPRRKQGTEPPDLAPSTSPAERRARAQALKNDMDGWLSGPAASSPVAYSPMVVFDWCREAAVILNEYLTEDMRLSLQPPGKLTFSVDEAAETLGVSRDLLYDQMRTGKLAYLKVGRRRIITLRQLEAFLNGTRTSENV